MSTVRLGQLARSGLERYMGRDLSAGVRAAAGHYAAKLRAGRTPVPLAGFLPELGEGGIAVELTLDRDDERVLSRQAGQLGVPICQLLAHAVLVYLAELELLGAAPAREECGGPGRPV